MLDIERFVDPPKAFRPSPFWSWNSRLELPELRRQIRLMKQQGYGGFFMHSREGLMTGYFSSEWFGAVRTCYREARQLDMEAWLYDEDRWPSGAAGGLVTRDRPELAPKALMASRIRSGQLRSVLKDQQTLAVYAIRRKGQRRLMGAERVTTARALEGELWRFSWYAQSPSNEFNGATYLDTLDAGAVKRFLDHTVGGYASNLRRTFGEHMPGIFTDEPNYCGAIWQLRKRRQGGLPYTTGLPAYFKKQTGLDLVEVLPDLFFDGRRSRAVRHHYHRCISLRFLESFTIPYAKRCRRHGLLMTGHWLEEDNLMVQTRASGAVMSHYWYMDVPGVDHLGRVQEHLLTHRQCSSVAHQAGRDRVLSELFGVSGQDMSFADQKWIGDYHLVNGINLFCPHLMLYSMLGDSKRDYPPTFSYHQPYWSRMRVVNDYFSRIGYMLSQGRPVADVLLLHSVGSARAVFAPGLNDLTGQIPGDWEPGLRLSSQLESTLALLVGDHRDVHLGDEYLLGKFGGVRGRQMVCGRMSYEVVVVPPSLTWESGTVKLLKRFVKAGGRVIFVRPTPKLIDGSQDGETWAGLISQANVTVTNRQGLAAVVGKVLARRVSVQDSRRRELADIRHAVRKDGKRQIVFLCNVNRTKGYSATIRLVGNGRVEQWDPLSGGRQPVGSRVVGGKTVLRHEFAPGGSLALVLDRAGWPAAMRKQSAEASETIALRGKWKFRRMHPNSMTLDFCRYSVDGGRLRSATPVWKVRRRLAELSGEKPYVGIQPWVKAKMKLNIERVPVTMQFDFNSDLEAPRVSLVVERLAKFNIRVNGKGLSSKTNQWHWDRKFAMVGIGHLVRRGRNRIELTTRYSLETPIEDIYLVGEFATRPCGKARFALTGEPDYLRGGDWGRQGYHFYAGNMFYSTQVKLPDRLSGRAMLRLLEPVGCGFVAHVNGQEVGAIPWQPWEIDVSEAVRPGLNSIGIEVLGTLRNTFGPLHNTDKRVGRWCGPASFSDVEHWSDSYQFVPYGLGRGAELVLSRR